MTYDSGCVVELQGSPGGTNNIVTKRQMTSTTDHKEKPLTVKVRPKSQNLTQQRWGGGIHCSQTPNNQQDIRVLTGKDLDITRGTGRFNRSKNNTRKPKKNYETKIDTGLKKLLKNYDYDTNP